MTYTVKDRKETFALSEVSHELSAATSRLERERVRWHFNQSKTFIQRKHYFFVLNAIPSPTGNITVSSKMSFDHLMAPLIVIAPELGKSADGKNPELRDHYEVVLFYDGINVWHHRYTDGKPSWYKLAYLKTKYDAKTVYDLQVTLRHTKKGAQMIIKCNGQEFGCAMPVEFTAKEYHAGIIACEGVNRFYDFEVK